MAWASRAWAVARAWSLDAAIALSLTLVAVALLTSDAYVEVPFLRNRLAVLHLLPVLTAMALGFPLVDRTPWLTLLSPHPALRQPLLRLGAVILVSLPLVAVLVALGWTLAAASVVLGFVGVVAPCAALLRLWYWAPMFGVLVAWAFQGPGRLAGVVGPEWRLFSAAALLLGGSLYVAAEAARVRRVVRGAPADSEEGRALDTIRP
ncbi:MAG TPA: hypothetical protein VNS46_19035 [Nocardioides sp.]|nr:hypothetical protein [Nocardioides sp.]